jgi:hypothetical protein
VPRATEQHTRRGARGQSDRLVTQHRSGTTDEDESRFFVDLVEPDHRTSGRPVPVSDDCVSAGLVDEWLQVRNELSIKKLLWNTPLPSFTRSAAPERIVNCVIRGKPEPSAASLRHPSLVDAVHPIVTNPRCGGGARPPGSPHRPLIEPLRQPSLSRLPKGRGGLSEKNFDPQRERHLQPLVDGIGASERETCCNQTCDEPESRRVGRKRQSSFCRLC